MPIRKRHAAFPAPGAGALRSTACASKRVAKNSSPGLIHLALITLALAACDGGGSVVHASSGSPASGGPVGDGGNAAGLPQVADLTAGDCTTRVDDSLFVREAAVGDCDEPRAMEVAGGFAYAQPPETSYPGLLAIRQRAYTRCQAVFEQFPGVAFWDSDYDIETIMPSASTWADGDREVVCLIVDMQGAMLATSLES